MKNPWDFKTEITRVLEEIKDLLLERNARYGNSALEPIRVFSKAGPIDQLYNRIDDKLSRIKNGEMTDEVINDIIGYLVILRVGKKIYELGEYQPLKKQVDVE